MDLVELLTVSDHFQLQRIGLVVAPDFSAPPGWKPRSETVTILTPDGRSQEAMVRIEVWHAEIRDPSVPADRRWRLVVSFPEMTKEGVPVGSRIMASQARCGRRCSFPMGASRAEMRLRRDGRIGAEKWEHFRPNPMHKLQVGAQAPRSAEQLAA